MALAFERINEFSRLVAKPMIDQEKAEVTPVVLLINAKKMEGIFSKYHDEYYQDVFFLKKDGYDVREINIGNFDELNQAVSHMHDGTISLLWVRAHGSSNSMEFSEDYKPCANDLSKTWTFLSSKLKKDATIVLNSCSTGKLESVDNIQLAFAELTMELPDVKIFAPKKDTSSCRVYRNGSGEFRVSMRRLDSRAELCVGMGEKTKEILREHKSQGLSDFPLEDIKNSRISAPEYDSKYCRTIFNGLSNRDGDILRSAIGRARGNLAEAFLLIIKYKSCDSLAIVKHLVEELKIPVNDPDFFQVDNPLFSAIESGDEAVVEYILSQGADVKSELFGRTPLQFASNPKNLMTREVNQEIIKVINKYGKME